MRTLAVLVLAAVAAAPAAVPAASAKGDPPLLGIVFKSQKPRLARLDAATLAPVGRGLAAAGAVPTWSFSPDRSRLALGALAPLRIRIFNVAPLRQVASLKLTGAGSAVAIAWPRPGRLLAAYTRPDGARIVWIDPSARRVLKREVLDVAPGPVVSAGDVVAALIPPAAGPGRARLVVATAGGAVREVALPSIPISLWAPTNGDEFKRDAPGLALDPDGSRAYVVGTNGAVASVDLATMGVATHLLARPFAKSMNGQELQARWLGGSALAVVGQSYATTVDAKGDEHVTFTPLGLRVVDVSTWTVRTLDRGATGFALAGGTLLAYANGMGVAAYGADGAPLFRALGGRQVAWVQTNGGRAYAWVPAKPGLFRVAVVDVASGAVQLERDITPTSVLAES